MNDQRRKEIKRNISGLEDIIAGIMAISEEEQEYLEAMPEAFQNGYRGERAQHTIDLLSSVDDALNNVIVDLEGAMEIW